MKKCSKCKNEKPIIDFYKSSFNKDGLHSWCKLCLKMGIKNAYLKRLYGIDLKKYEEMLFIQDGGCAICNKKEDTFLKLYNCNKSLAVDHNKTTGKIRGILCENCNRAIGLLKHNTNLLENAINYLNQF